MGGLTPTIEHYPIWVRLLEDSSVPGSAICPLVRRAPSLHDTWGIRPGAYVGLRGTNLVLLYVVNLQTTTPVTQYITGTQPIRDGTSTAFAEYESSLSTESLVSTPSSSTL